MKILDYNHCRSEICQHHPVCGWNITLSGTDEKELAELKKFVSPAATDDETDYGGKMGTERFLDESTP